ncbi:MAG: AAA family ATPase, partial [Acutalibacteraceae bacterium]
MEKRIICIGRKFGSGGHEIAVKLSAKLGIPVYEKNLVHLACNYGELAVKTLEKADEKATNPYLFQAVHEGNHHVTRGLPTSEVLFKLQSEEIKRIASQESCIFVGRCADYVLESIETRLLKVFVTAPFEYRVRRKMNHENLKLYSAGLLVKKMDKQRKKYYESYTGREWGNPDFYDLYIDTGITGIDDAVSQIA